MHPLTSEDQDERLVCHDNSFVPEPLVTVLESKGYKVRPPSSLSWDTRMLKSTNGLNTLKNDYDLNYEVPEEDLQDHERRFLAKFSVKFCSTTPNIQNIKSQQHTTHESTLNNTAKELLKDNLDGVISENCEPLIEKESFPVPGCCIPGNAESRFYAPDMVCISRTNVGMQFNDGMPTGYVYAPLILGEIDGDVDGAQAALPQATSSAMAAALTLLTLGILYDEIAVPFFTVSFQEFRFYLLTIVTQPKFQFRLHSLDGVNVTSGIALSPVIDTEPVAEMFDKMRVHAFEMWGKLNERPIQYYLTVPVPDMPPNMRKEDEEEEEETESEEGTPSEEFAKDVGEKQSAEEDVTSDEVQR
ncbi:hypothetical protein HDU76_004077 [Blyttiomyces sp. JEL0837]|nr:hypothetical protein HDU76_004077 [Blyttiomyces sp. JEL0837]